MHAIFRFPDCQFDYHFAVSCINHAPLVCIVSLDEGGTLLPARINPQDWDRLFRPDAPRRGGPLNALVNVLIVGTFIALIGIGGTFLLRYNAERTRMLTATQIAVATTQAGAHTTRTAQAAATQTVEAGAVTAATGTAAADATAVREAALGVGSVVVAGNLRSAPRIAPDTVLGQVCIGDQVVFREEQNIGADRWYRIRVTSLAEDCDPQRVPVGSEGWANSTLLSEPNP